MAGRNRKLPKLRRRRSRNSLTAGRCVACIARLRTLSEGAQGMSAFAVGRFGARRPYSVREAGDARWTRGLPAQVRRISCSAEQASGRGVYIARLEDFA